MMSLTNSIFTAVIGLGLLSTGCATKKFVRNHVAPNDQRVGAAEKKSTEQAAGVVSRQNLVTRNKGQVKDGRDAAAAAGGAAEKVTAKTNQAHAARESGRTAEDSIDECA